MKFDKGPDFRQYYPDVPEDHALLVGVLQRITADGAQGTALEFGVATGTTLNLIAKVLPVIGFDSFEGLPENWRPGFPKGKFAGPLPEVPENAQLVVGRFEETMPIWSRQVGWPVPVSLVHIDCDLYSSTVTVLRELEGVIERGTYIVFDEFFGYPGAEQHEQRAWIDFLFDTGYEFDVVGHGREQWAVRIK